MWGETECLMFLSWSVLFVGGRMVRKGRWQGSEVGRRERWEVSDVERWGRWEGSEVGKVRR